jgi:hypothetical protein
MKTLALLTLVAGLGLLAGCASPTPGYSGDERYAQIGRNWNLEGEEFADDMDHALLLRPSGTLTVWDVYHRD